MLGADKKSRGRFSLGSGEQAGPSPLLQVKAPQDLIDKIDERAREAKTNRSDMTRKLIELGMRAMDAKVDPPPG